jgi:hypothetical protein
MSARSNKTTLLSYSSDRPAVYCGARSSFNLRALPKGGPLRGFSTIVFVDRADQTKTFAATIGLAPEPHNSAAIVARIAGRWSARTAQTMQQPVHVD